MRRSTLLIAFACLATLGWAADPVWHSLWNGRDFEGWTSWVGKPQPTSVVPGAPKDASGKYIAPLGRDDRLKIFSIATAEGKPAIRISGEVFGELRSRDSFRDYRLRLQFKWGEKKWPPRDKPATPRDSGLLYHVHTEPGAEGRTWARSIELQIQEHDVGDLYAVGSLISVHSRRRPGTDDHPIFDYDPTAGWNDFSQVPGSDGRCVKQPDNENPTGQWNTVELICFGSDSIHVVNGKVVMRLHNPRRIDRPTPEPVTSGPIILQSEGAEVFYRAIEWRPITAIPAEFL
jgi:hypothetical protein